MGGRLPLLSQPRTLLLVLPLLLLSLPLRCCCGCCCSSGSPAPPCACSGGRRGCGCGCWPAGAARLRPPGRRLGSVPVAALMAWGKRLAGLAGLAGLVVRELAGGMIPTLRAASTRESGRPSGAVCALDSLHQWGGAGGGMGDRWPGLHGGGQAEAQAWDTASGTLSSCCAGEMALRRPMRQPPRRPCSAAQHPPTCWACRCCCWLRGAGLGGARARGPCCRAPPPRPQLPTAVPRALG